MTGRMLDLIRACRINSAWLILQRVTRSENSAYSSSVKRVLITRWRWGVLYLFMAFNSFLFMLCPLTNRRKTGGKTEVFFEKSENIFSGIFQAAQAAKRRAWGGNPNKIPIGQNERLAKFGTVVESCSKKVAASSVWASVNTFSAASGDFAKAAAIFLPLLPTTPRKAKMTVIYGNSFLSSLHGIILAIFENAKNGRKKTGNLF